MNGRAPLVLVVEDEMQMRRLLRTLLHGHGYEVAEATSGNDAMVQAATRNPDLILLDLGLPDIDGLTVCERIREWSRRPIIVISARGKEEDKVRALDLGADDYLTKPFGAQELLARVRVALRRGEERLGDVSAEPFVCGELRVDLVNRRVERAGAELRLTPTEYKLLAVLVRHAGRVITHAQILREVWGPAFVDQAHYVRVFMAQLRRKLEDDPARPHYIVTEAGVGYRLRADSGDGEPTRP